MHLFFFFFYHLYIIIILLLFFKHLFIKHNEHKGRPSIKEYIQHKDYNHLCIKNK